MHNQERILLISWDPRLLLTQSLILGAYFQVDTAARALEAKLLLDRYHFDLIIVCATISPAECEKIVREVLAQPYPLKVLRLGTSTFTRAGLECFSMEQQESPLSLLRMSASLLGFELQSRGRMVRTKSSRKVHKALALSH